MKASSQAADWADTLSIWIHPSGTLASKLCHLVYQDDTGESLTDLEHQALIDQDSQRLGLTLLNLLNTAPETNLTQGDAWKGFMLALSFSGDLLTPLTHAITNPLADGLNIVSLQGVESLCREFLEVKQWTRDGPAVQIMITLLISEGLLSKVLEKTRLYSQGEGSQLNTNTASLLLTLSLRAHTTDARIRMELSRAIHILSVGGTRQIQDLLTGWLEDALLRFPWIWPTVRKARTIPLLMTRMEFTCHALQNNPSNLVSGLRATDVLYHLCQDPSYCSDVLNSGTHLLLQSANIARLMQMVRPDKDDLIGSLAQDIQFAIMECVKLMTVPRPQADPPHGIIKTPPSVWNVETTCNWILKPCWP